MNKKTKIICTLGPATDSVKKITELIISGMDAARLNFSHGTYAHHKKIIKNIRAASKKLNKPIAIIQDLQGPKIRVGEMPEEGVVLLKGEKVTLTTQNILGDHKKIPVQYKNLPKEVSTKDVILLCDGTIELTVTRVQKNIGRIFCKVKVGGIVKSHKGINLPNATIKAPCLTKKDLQDLDFGLKQNVDYIALSFVKEAKDILQLRKIIQSKKKTTAIIAKIERKEAIKNLEEIIEATDAAMVARGDLGAEVSPEKVPLIQKKIIATANTYGKPVITATEILQSMIKNPRATRAEMSDAANAVLDHTDCLMLSNETAVGDYPVQATHTLSKAALSIESHLAQEDIILENEFKNSIISDQNSLCLSACHIAQDIKADFIIILTEQGYTAKQIAKHRTFTPVITITNSKETQKQLALVWGLNKILISRNLSSPPKHFIRHLIKKKLITENSTLVFCNASHKESFIKIIHP